MQKSNYEIMRDQMRSEFIKYDQDNMIHKFSLEYDADFLYIPFVLRRYRIGRKNGIVEWSEDMFITAVEADYNESMTIYDVLCYSKPDCRLSGKFCPSNMLKGTVKSFSTGSSFFQKYADRFRGKTAQLKQACALLGTPAQMSGDAAFILYPFSFLPITLQYWDADEEFPPNLKFMFDENVQDYMHFETTYFMVGHILHRIEELMKKT